MFLSKHWDMKLFVVLIFICTYSFGRDTLAIKIDSQVQLLKSQGIDTIIIHRYSLFNGRFEIPSENRELECNVEPTMAHLFWCRNKEWFCLRMDNCEPFKVVENVPIDFVSISIDPRIKFRKKGAHFTLYKLTILTLDRNDLVSLSGDQLREDKSRTSKSIKSLNALIRKLEDTGAFKRA
jgi:hypothetical protein